MPRSPSRLELRLLLLAGFGACLAYPLGVFAPLPDMARVILLAWFGPLLGLGSYGLFLALSLRRRSPCGAIGAGANAIAGALFAAMVLVQLAAGMRGDGPGGQWVWLGLDVAWDLYIGTGTALFAVAAFGHEWYGKGLGIAGMAVAAVLLVFNLATFPTPPANAGLFDAGPLVGLWYLAITIASWRGLRRWTGSVPNAA